MNMKKVYVLAIVLALFGCKKTEFEKPQEIKISEKKAPEKTILQRNKEWIIGRWVTDSIYYSPTFTSKNPRVVTFDATMFYSGNTYMDIEYKIISVDSLEVFRPSPYFIDTMFYKFADTNQLTFGYENRIWYCKRKL